MPSIEQFQDAAGNTNTLGWLSVGSDVVGSLFPSGDSDWYRISLKAGVTYSFSLSGSALDGTLALVGAGNAVLASANGASAGGTETLSWTAATTGTYYVSVASSASGTVRTGTYRLAATSDAPDDFGALPATATPASLGQTVAGTLEIPSDADWQAFQLTAGHAYAVVVSGTTLADPYIAVLDRNEALVANASSSAGTARLTVAPSASGTCYVDVESRSGTGTGGYAVAMWELPVVSVAGASTIEGNDGSHAMRFAVNLSAPSPVAVTVSYATRGQTARAGTDYAATTGSLTIPAGAAGGFVDVPVIGNTVFQPARSLQLVLSGPANAVLGSASTGTGTILDDDAPAGVPVPADGLSKFEWHLWAVDAFRAWQDATGAGVRVVVFDSGVDGANQDLGAQVDTALGRNSADLSAGGSPVTSSDNHGTIVAGVIAAADNDYGVVGVAYGASLVSIYDPSTYTNYAARIANAFSYAGAFDVVNDSWGYGNLFLSGTNWAFYDNFSSPAFSAAGTALKALADTGRAGLGTIVVQSAGNSFGYGDDTNLHNFQNSRYVITVAATTYAGEASSFSSTGASILVSAPGGDGSGGPTDILSTDRVGAAGTTSTDTTWEAGTSFSAPIVSGVVALMLEANPHLGWRDVQEILAYSARRIGTDQNTWRSNGAGDWNGGGLHYDAITHDLGFGLVDAGAAVRLALTWGDDARTSANLREVVASTSPKASIPDNGVAAHTGGATSTIEVVDALRVERVDVKLDVTHPYVGDLAVELTSPSGTTSVLLARPGAGALSAFGSSQDNIHFTFDTVLDWGESSKGTWSLTVYDMAAGDRGTLDAWTLDLVGAPESVDDRYVYTDEYASALAGDAARGTLRDASGIDTLDAAALSGDALIDLRPGATSSIAGAALAIGADTTIENAIGGDGDDTVTGNDAANALRGMRGDDVLSGGGGDDTLDGGAGTDTARWDGPRARYTVSFDGRAFEVVDKTGGDGTDALVSIEALRFSDQTVPIAGSSAHVVPGFDQDPGFLFDPVYYLLDNPDLVASTTLATAWQQYLSAGAKDGRAPNAWFDATYYGQKWADLSALHLDAATLFEHFDLYGVWEGRAPGPAFEHFDGSRYLAENPDVAAYVDAHLADFLGSRTNGAIAHFIIYGAGEQRVAHDVDGTLIGLGYSV